MMVLQELQGQRMAKTDTDADAVNRGAEFKVEVIQMTNKINSTSGTYVRATIVQTIQTAKTQTEPTG